MKNIKLKIKLFTCVVIVLWMVAFSQVLINQLFSHHEEITQAFSSTDTDISESCLIVTASYDNKQLSDTEKQEIVKQIATKIGLTSSYECKSSTENGKQQVLLSKEGQYATTNISIVSVGNQQYFHIQLKIYERPESGLYYKKLIAQEMKALDAQNYDENICFNSEFPGKMSAEDERHLTNRFLKALDAETVYENDSNHIYTNYAYTPTISKTLKCNDKKVNVNVAITYDETKKTTKLYVATPIINTDF